jgi:chromate reductase
MRILTICGSLQAQSGNRSLLEVAGRVAPEGVEVIRFDGLRDLPFFDPDLGAVTEPPAVGVWRRAIADADGILIASPEYGHSLPGCLKNGVDWLIGSGELYRKIVAITASVGDPRRGRMGLSALAQTLGAVDAVIAWNEPTLHGPGSDAAIAGILQRLIEIIAARAAEAE